MRRNLLRCSTDRDNAISVALLWKALPLVGSTLPRRFDSRLGVAHAARYLSKKCDFDLPSAFLASELFFDNPTNPLA